MSIRPIDMQGMVRNTTQNQQNAQTASSNNVTAQAYQKVIQEKAENLTHKTEKPAEERKKLEKDNDGTRQDLDQRRKKRKKREEEAENKEHRRLDEGMFDISI